MKRILLAHVSIPRAARVLKVSPQSVGRYIRQGVGGRRLKSFKIGGRRRIYVHDLRAFVAAGASDTDQRPMSRTTNSLPVDSKLDALLAAKSIRKTGKR